ncbi:phage tail assembly chaperone [Pseudomonas chlororaphis]|uniref:phage tail assembly chaperone n=1 Tax=Pseudomonas chlororaphis TaxID=587753 RepID=UPI001E4862DF|nr:phage tail assembly chaperone [Pseudomonas chlororaphis]MCB2255367.1 phage tail assembly chaperone [Pseudomonas chlororaphis]
MALYSSRSQACFLDDSINILPDDAWPITAEEHSAYLRAELDGKAINFETEPPSLIARPAQAPEVSAEIERRWRDEWLSATDSVVSRHRDELEEGADTTLTAAQYSELQAYRRELRNWPESGEFPLVDHRPRAPLWLAEQIQ